MGLKSSEAGKLGGINDFCIYPDINWIGKLTNVDGVQVDGGCAKCHVGLGAKPTAAPTNQEGLHFMYSVVGRTAARVLETQVIAHDIEGWADELTIGGNADRPTPNPTSGTGMGLNEAPSGALGHWINVRNRKIGNYLLSGRRLQRIVMALQTAREIRMAGRGALWIAGRVVTFEALFVSGNIRMDFRIPPN